MECFVYRSTRRPETYLFVPRANDFEDVPDELLEHLGRLEFALDFQLGPERSLAQADPRTVIAHLEKDGFYLQLPDRWWERGA